MPRAQDPPEVLERFDSALDLVDIVAHQVRRAIGVNVEQAELVSFGREGLLDAARRFDPDRGVPFRAYANYRVRGSIIDGVRSVARLPRRVHERLRGLGAAARTSEGALEDVCGPPPPGAGPTDVDRALSDHLAAMATAMATGLVAPTAPGEDGTTASVSLGDSPEELTARAELLELVSDAIEGLPRDEAALVRRHYLEGERFDSVAKDLGLSKSWASRLHTRAVRRLTKRLRGATE